MRMTADVGIVVIPAVVGGNLLNLSGLLQQGQVAVNGAEADPRIFPVGHAGKWFPLWDDLSGAAGNGR